MTNFPDKNIVLAIVGQVRKVYDKVSDQEYICLLKRCRNLDWTIPGNFLPPLFLLETKQLDLYEIYDLFFVVSTFNLEVLKELETQFTSGKFLLKSCSTERVNKKTLQRLMTKV